MKIPLSWLRDYVPVTLPPEELAHRLTMAGIGAGSPEPVPGKGRRRRGRRRKPGGGDDGKRDAEPVHSPSLRKERHDQDGHDHGKPAISMGGHVPAFLLQPIKAKKRKK